MATIPIEPSAVKLKNFLVKEYAGRYASGISQSNPYADRQFMRVHLRPDCAKRLHGQLQASEGWTLDQSNVSEAFKALVFPYEHSSGARVQIYHSQYADDDSVVTVSGLKKAKRLTVPYYD